MRRGEENPTLLRIRNTTRSQAPTWKRATQQSGEGNLMLRRIRMIRLRVTIARWPISPSCDENRMPHRIQWTRSTAASIMKRAASHSHGGDLTPQRIRTVHLKALTVTRTALVRVATVMFLNFLIITLTTIAPRRLARSARSIRKQTTLFKRSTSTTMSSFSVPGDDVYIGWHPCLLLQLLQRISRTMRSGSRLLSTPSGNTTRRMEWRGCLSPPNSWLPVS